MVGWSDLAISDGQMEGGKISFTVQMDPGYALRYHGDVSANQMQLTLVDRHAGSSLVTGVRIAADGTVCHSLILLVVRLSVAGREPAMGDGPIKVRV